MLKRLESKLGPEVTSTELLAYLVVLVLLIRYVA